MLKLLGQPVRSTVTLLVAASCVAGLEPGEGPHFQTNADSYVLSDDGRGWRTEIPYTFQNRFGRPVFLVNCRGSFALHLDRLEAGEWQPRWSPVIAACLSAPIEIAPDEIFRDTVRVWGAKPGVNAHPAFDVPDPSGEYRLVWDAALWSFQDRLPFGEPIPEAARTSNTFTLEVP